MQHSVESLAAEFDVTLIGPKGCGQFAPAGVQAIECPPSPFSFLTTALLKGWRAARKMRFDLVLGGSGLVGPVTALLSGIARARSVIFVHGLDLVVDNWIYQRLFVPFLRKHDLVIANSHNTRKIAVDKGCRADRIAILNPGSTIPPDSLLRDTASTRARLGLEHNRIVLFVGRIVKRKGLAEFLEKAWPSIVARQPGAVMLVVGDSAENALLQDPKAAKSLVDVLERRGKESVRFLGAVDDDELWSYYAASDVLVFPLIRVKGDVEGFGMVAIEAAASGTPTVAFPVGGVVDAVAEGVSGSLVPEGNYEAFADAVVSICEGGQPSSSDCRNHAMKFSWDVHGQKLLSLLKTP